MARVTFWVFLLAVLGGLGGLAFFKVTPPVYEVRGLVMAEPASADLQRSGQGLLRSPAVFHAAVQSASAASHTEKAQKLLRQEGALFEAAHVNPTSDSVIELRLDSTAPELAKLLVGDWIKAYNLSAAKTNQAQAKSKLASTTTDLARAKLRLDTVEGDIAELKRKTGIVDVTATVEQATNYEATLTGQRDADQAALETTRHQANQERQQLAGIPKVTEATISESTNPVLKNLREHLGDLNRKRATDLGIFREDSQHIREIDDQIKATEAEIAKIGPSLSVDHRESQPNPQRRALEESYFGHLAQIEGFKGSLTAIGRALEKHRASTQSLPKAQLDMVRLSREQTVAESTYKELRNTYEALTTGTAAPVLPTLTVFTPAEASPSPLFPKLVPCLSWGAGAGAFLGLLVGLIAVPRRQPASAVPERAPVGPELPVLVAVPPLPSRRRDGIETLALGSGSPAEAYRFMVFSLQARENPAKTILFTGVSHDSLCAEAAAQFAVAMAQTGTRTLLIDCNLRDPSLTKSFGFFGKSGITDILSRTMLPSAENDLVLETAHPDLYFLPAGTLESEGIGGFQNLQVQGMLQDVMERAEIKVVNAPACAIVSDASRLARHFDQICLVANKNDQSRGLVHKAENVLRLAGASEIEVVLIDERRSRESFIA